jgi:hypothetical protein
MQLSSKLSEKKKIFPPSSWQSFDSIYLWKRLKCGKLIDAK